LQKYQSNTVASASPEFKQEPDHTSNTIKAEQDIVKGLDVQVKTEDEKPTSSAAIVPTKAKDERDDFLLYNVPPLGASDHDTPHSDIVLPKLFITNGETYLNQIDGSDSTVIKVRLSGGSYRVVWILRSHNILQYRGIDADYDSDDGNVVEGDESSDSLVEKVNRALMAPQAVAGICSYPTPRSDV
jgi:hypothetical protein